MLPVLGGLALLGVVAALLLQGDGEGDGPLVPISP
jgi:hypothetical protein